MKVKYLGLIALLVGIVLTVQSQDMPSMHVVMGPIPKPAGRVSRTTINISQAYLNYVQSDSANYPLSYFMSYMFYINSRYTIKDTGNNLANELLLQDFSVLFDTILDAPTSTAYSPAIIRNIVVDSLSIIIGHNNWSGTQDTIVVQIDSVDATGYITSKVLYADTIKTSVGLSPSNNWLNPINLVIKPPVSDTIRNTKFAVKVSYYGSKFDTMGFLPGFGYANCISGGNGAIPKPTFIGNKFGTLRANSLTSGYKYFFSSTQTIPTSSGNMFGLYVPCSNPVSKYWYFQDNPISAYISFTNVTGIDEVSPEGFTITQNFPNPFNKSTEIAYDIKKASAVEFYVCDLAGRRVLTETYPSVSPGRHTISLNGSQFSPGIYLYTLKANGSAVTRKMVVTQ